MQAYQVKAYWAEELVCVIDVGVDGTVSFENFGHEPYWVYPFGVAKEATLKDLMEFYEDRCFPRERENCKQVLHSLGLDCYEPEMICRKTHGQQFDDFLWLQFSDEPQVSYEEIRLR